MRFYQTQKSKLLEDLNKLAANIRKGQLKDPKKIQRKIGAYLSRHPRAAKYYEVELDEKSSPGRLTWKRKDEPYQGAEELTGCYVLRTNDTTMTGDELWHLYMTLTTAEEGFKALKSDLGLRPNFHYLEVRCDAHIFITILAYQLLRYITYTLSLKGDRRTWQTLRRALQTHGYATLLVPTKDGRLYRMRKAGLPEECQRQIYHDLGIDYRNLPRSKVVVHGTTIGNPAKV